MRIRTIIADDEELARRGLKALSLRCEDLELVCECRNGQEAVDAIYRHRPDLVFLDVQMPGISGFEVIAATADAMRPHVIFVTAYDRFALRAFEVNALDYLLKPVNEERFDSALARVREAMSHATDDAIVRRIRQAAAEFPTSTSASRASPVERLPIKVNGHIILVRVADVDWIEADRDYVSLHVGDKIWLMRETIAAMELRLAMSGFVRIHRSTLVNTERVKELRPHDKGEYAVILNDGTELKLTRNYRVAIERLLGVSL